MSTEETSRTRTDLHYRLPDKQNELQVEIQQLKKKFGKGSVECSPSLP